MDIGSSTHNSTAAVVVGWQSVFSPSDAVASSGRVSWRFSQGGESTYNQLVGQWESTAGSGSQYMQKAQAASAFWLVRPPRAGSLDKTAQQRSSRK